MRVSNLYLSFWSLQLTKAEASRKSTSEPFKLVMRNIQEISLPAPPFIRETSRHALLHTCVCANHPCKHTGRRQTDIGSSSGYEFIIKFAALIPNKNALLLNDILLDARYTRFHHGLEFRTINWKKYSPD